VVDGRRAAFALGAFVCAADGTLAVGLLPGIARDLRVSSAAAGQSVSVFAAVYAVGSPLLVRLLRRTRLQRLLLGALMLFIASNLATGLAPDLRVLLGARAAAAVAAGLIVPTSSAAIAAVTEPWQRGRALSTVIAGGAAGTALGIPAGTLIGAATSWRVAFLLLAAIAAATAGVVAFVVPSSEQAAGRSDSPPTAALRALPVLVVTLVWALGSFVFFTYASKVLHQAAGVTGGALALFLLVYGVWGVVASKGAGWLTDLRGAHTTLYIALSLTALSILGLGLLAGDERGDADHAAAAAVLFALYAIGTWSVTPPQQFRLLGLDGNERTFIALNASALYAGVALGGVVGGAVLAAGYSTAYLCWIAAGIVGLALTIVAISAPRPSRTPRPAEKSEQRGSRLRP
jgi:predicted MFS family arabinose efflux permease